jgi:hypothetical protein
MRFSPDRLLEFPQKETRYSSPDGRFSVESTDMLMTKKLQDPEFRTRYEELVAATKITVEDADRIVVDVNEGQTSRQLTLQVEMNLPGESDGYPWRVMADEEGFPAFYFQVLPGRSVEEQLMDSIKNWLSWKVEAQQ